MRILLSGGSGLIGSRYIAAGRHRFAVLSRSSQPVKGAETLTWPHEDSPDFEAQLEALVEEIDRFGGNELAVVHLAGANVGQRWTERHKAAIYTSRIASSELLARILSKLKRKPLVYVGMAAIGIYGEQGDMICTEEAASASSRLAGHDARLQGLAFLRHVCRDWELAHHDVREQCESGVIFRLGVVFDHREGAFDKLITPVRLGVGGRIGSGRQFISWIHINDVLRAIDAAVDGRISRGTYNLAAPHPVRQKDLTDQAAAMLKRPALLPAPSFAIRLLLKDGADIVLGSQRVSSNRLKGTGFSFQYPDLNKALADLLKPAAG